MPTNITQYKLLISCPGDVVEEIEIIDKCVQSFNDHFSATLGIAIQTCHWLKSSYPQSGGKPQAILNDQFVNKCDAAIAVFWTRFGTKTDKYGSGTEEEIEIMLQEGKQIFLYFSDKPANPSQIDQKQYDNVKEMKNKYSDRVYYWNYSSVEEFEKMLFSHLTDYFISLRKIEEIKSNKSLLHIQSIKNGKKVNELTISRLIHPESSESNRIHDEITGLLKSLCSYSLDCYRKPVSNGNPFLGRCGVASSMLEPVVISENIRETIQLYTKRSGDAIDEKFFNLGNLCENKLYGGMFASGGSAYSGSSEEKQRYHDILLLSKRIEDFVSWCIFEETYSEFHSISFVLSNSGTTFDEDIDVTLIFDNSDLVLRHYLPVPDDAVLEYFCDHIEYLATVFSLESTPEYQSYEMAQTRSTSSELRYVPDPWPNSRDFLEDYNNSLDSIFDYDIYQNDDNCILKLNFDYIKQHTSIAFPSKLIINKSIKRISYKISSKHSPEIVEGELIVRDDSDD